MPLLRVPSKIALAEAFARVYHEHQTDKAGRPYIEHIERVVRLLEKYELPIRIVGWLHDTIEDTKITIEDIGTSFGSDIADAVALLTRDKTLPYEVYIDRLRGSKNRWAIIVKYADLADHLQQPGCPESLLPRYIDALMRLAGMPIR